MEIYIFQSYAQYSHIFEKNGSQAHYSVYQGRRVPPQRNVPPPSHPPKNVSGGVPFWQNFSGGVPSSQKKARLRRANRYCKTSTLTMFLHPRYSHFELAAQKSNG